MTEIPPEEPWDDITDAIEIAAKAAPNHGQKLRRERAMVKRRKSQNKTIEGLIARLAHLELL